MTGLLKILFDLCFFYTFSGFYLYIFTENYASGWGVPVFMLSVCIYMMIRKKILTGKIIDAYTGEDNPITPGTSIETNRKNRKSKRKTKIRERKSIAEIIKSIDPIKVICCLIPAVMLLFDLTLWQILQFIPAWVFFIIKIWQNRIYTSREEFVDQFKLTGGILGVAGLGLVIVSRSGLALAGVIPYLVTYLLTGVCLTRTLREEGKLTAARNITTMGTLLICSVVLAFLQAPQWIFYAIGFIYNNILIHLIKWIAIAIGSVIYAIAYLLSLLGRLFKFNMDIGEFELPQIENENPTMFMEEGEIIQEEFPLWVQVAAFIFFLILIGFICYLILRKLLGNKFNTEKDKLYTEVQETLNIKERKTRSGIFRPRDNRQAVRWYYRKYLTEGISRGANRSRQDTSRCIMEKYVSVFPENESISLRELYIEARYSDKKELQKSDVQKAADLWNGLKQSRKLPVNADIPDNSTERKS